VPKTFCNGQVLKCISWFAYLGLLSVQGYSVCQRYVHRFNWMLVQSKSSMGGWVTASSVSIASQLPIHNHSYISSLNGSNLSLRHTGSAAGALNC
jgi:hypothetical protein